MMVDIGYAIFMLFIGVIGTFSIGYFWAAGPVGRVWIRANISGKRILEIPRDDRTIDYARPKVDSKGRWHTKDKGEVEVCNIDPLDVNIAGGKIAVVTGLDNMGITSHAEAAALAPHAQAGEGEAHYTCQKEDCGATWTGFVGKLNLCPTCSTPAEPKGTKALSKITTILKHGRRSVSWASIKARARDVVGPGNLAAVIGSVSKAHHPVPDDATSGMSTGKMIAIGAIALAGVIAVIGLVIAKQQGLF